MPPKAPYCEGAKRSFNPDAVLRDWVNHPPLDDDPFAGSIIVTFGLSGPEDKYVYSAGPANVTLLQAQTALLAGGSNGLHAWYCDAEGNEVCKPVESFATSPSERASYG